MAIVILFIILLMCFWGESIVFGTKPETLSCTLISIARFIHMYNFGTAVTVLYVFVQLVSDAYVADAANVFDAVNVTGGAHTFLFMYIGIVTFVLNIAFYRSVYTND